MKKNLDVTHLTNELEHSSVFFKSPSSELSRDEENGQQSHQTPTQDISQTSTLAREVSSDNSREKTRELSPKLPTRDAIQEFSFHLRDALKVKVQAEVPYQWQDELDELARGLKVKKLELYRYIIGDFLGKTKPPKG